MFLGITREKRYPDRRVVEVWCGMPTMDSTLGAPAEHRERVRDPERGHSFDANWGEVPKRT